MPSFTRESGGTLHAAVMGVNRIGKEPPLAIPLAIAVAITGCFIITCGFFPEPIQRVVSKLPFWTKARQPNSHSKMAQPSLKKIETRVDRQPINQAYKYLVGQKIVKEDGNEPMQIAGLLRQAALDGEVVIWGSEPSSAPVEWQAPTLLEINRGYWRQHGIDPVRLMIDTSKLPEEGCKTQRESRPWNDQTECCWHLHVDMNQVGSIWREHTRPDNE